MDTHHLHCIVIGAGGAGLAAAAALRIAGVHVAVVEANSRVGGRICQDVGWGEWGPVDLGAEFVHGSNTTIYKLAKQQGWPLTSNLYSYDLRETSSSTNSSLQRDFVYHNNQLISMQDSASCPDLQQAIELIYKVYSLDLHYRLQHNQKDMAMTTFLREEGASEGAVAIVQSILAQEMSSKMNDFSVYETCRLCNAWSVGNDNYRINGSFVVLIDYYLKQIGAAPIKLSWQATRIEYRDSTSGTSSRVVVTNQHGDTLEASYVIITVPLTVLRDGDIDFNPPLPQSKVVAAKNLSMEVSYKIICRFQKVFWPCEFGSICCSNGFASHIHQDCRYQKFAQCFHELSLDRKIEKILNQDDLHSDGCFMLSGFQTAELAEAKERLSDEEMTKGFLDQLNEIFGDKTGVNSSKTPASDNFMGSIVKRWSTEPFIRGSYSGPSLGSAQSDYCHIARPVGDCIFFAGEATCMDIPSTVEGAVITGERAARMVLTKLQK